MPIVYGGECQRETYIPEIPCIVITSWEYSTACTDNYVTIHNDTGQSITVKQLNQYGNTNLCNFTFNYSGPGIYYYNISSNDTGVINVINMTEESSMATIAIIGFVTIISLMVLFLPKMIKRFSDNEILNTVTKGGCIALGIFLLTLVTAMTSTVSDKFGLGLNTEIFRFMWLLSRVGYLIILYVVLKYGKMTLDTWNQTKYNRKMGYNENSNT